MYLLYESLYGDFLSDCDSTNIISLYNTKEKAINKAKDLIERYTMDDGYVLDEERKDIEKDNFVRLFRGWQENWSCYFEIIIKKMEVE